MTNKSLERTTFEGLSRLYVIALSTIALSIVISQILVQRHLSNQLDDSRVVNVAGRQRMLSQKITKEILLLQKQEEQPLSDLDETLQLWINSHIALQEGNKELGLPKNESPTIKVMFQELKPYFETISKNAKSIIQQQESKRDSISIQKEVEEILINESPFLEQMDRIVFQFDREAREKVNKLRRTELLLLLAALFILILELLFIFRPAAVQVRKTIRELVDAK
ncbi:MAG: type IV pili methyl-accepting chemotaxis transducer N-terminal domain-containing protein, partial [Bacteroidota bacterium]